jgi:hypothetical protein
MFYKAPDSILECELHTKGDYYQPTPAISFSLLQELPPLCCMRYGSFGWHGQPQWIASMCFMLIHKQSTVIRGFCRVGICVVWLELCLLKLSVEFTSWCIPVWMRSSWWSQASMAGTHPWSHYTRLRFFSHKKWWLMKHVCGKLCGFIHCKGVRFHSQAMFDPFFIRGSNHVQIIKWILNCLINLHLVL